jgi:hypothetical protein
MTDLLTISERIRDDGTREAVTLEAHGGALWLRVGDDPPDALPEDGLERVMKRYGKPLSPDVELRGPRLDVGAGRELWMLRHLARYDVIAKDFLVWLAPGEEPLAELAVGVTAALVHLARAARGRR